MMNIEKKEVYKLLYPRLTVLVSSGEKGNKNVMTVAWSTPISFDPPLVGVSISPKRKTHELIDKTNQFGINIPTEELAEETYFVGKESGKEINKFEETDLTPFEGKTGVPLIEECYANLECEVVDKPVYGDHTFFIGEVEAARAKKEAIEEDGFPDPSEKMLFWRSSGDKSDYLTF